jgi:hypothetical protein
LQDAPEQGATIDPGTANAERQPTPILRDRLRCALCHAGGRGRLRLSAPRIFSKQIDDVPAAYYAVWLPKSTASRPTLQRWQDFPASFDQYTNIDDPYIRTSLMRTNIDIDDKLMKQAMRVLQGVRDEPAAADVERRLLKLEVFNSGGVEVAREAARNYRILRGRGHTVRKTVDV